MTSTAIATDTDTALVEPPSLRRDRRGLIIGLVVGAVVLGLGLSLPYVVSDTYTMALAVEAALLGMLALGLYYFRRVERRFADIA